MRTYLFTSTSVDSKIVRAFSKCPCSTAANNAAMKNDKCYICKRIFTLGIYRGLNSFFIFKNATDDKQKRFRKRSFVNTPRINLLFDTKFNFLLEIIFETNAFWKIYGASFFWNIYCIALLNLYKILHENTTKLG